MKWLRWVTDANTGSIIYMHTNTHTHICTHARTCAHKRAHAHTHTHTHAHNLDVKVLSIYVQEYIIPYGT